MWSIIMAKNGNKEGMVELWGREFNLAKNGLDETQIVSFVNELMSERDQLMRQAEHLATLTKLAEKTVVEADKLAEEIKKETTEQTEAEATAIIAKAEEQARQMIKEKRTEIITIVTKEAETIKANAEREAGLLVERERERIQPELRDLTQQLYRELLSQLKSLKQQITTLEVEFEHKLSQPAEQTSIVTMEKEPLSAQVPATIQQASNITAGIGSEVSLERAEDKSAEPQQPTQTIDQANTSELEEEAPLSVDSQAELIYNDEVELEILPPIDVKQIMGIMRYLDSLSEIKNTELIPVIDRPLIIVSLREPMHLIEILRTLPEVGEAKEVTNEGSTTVTDADAEGRRRKIRITLSGNSVLDEAKERLGSEVSHTLSS